ncbi:hypothetical protein HB364_19725 [Pseudoflavitalea sp. X16]|uniref:hypothetical protein n=1 Tax=Paraflavitalea devenefica TaxID=2716334 RepID=UPI00142301CA|nr:hypothetical protein [Paraflavitalea devenefica]NII27329.1 hypothetical protein [Paraflavitalea devenefica]
MLKKLFKALRGKEASDIDLSLGYSRLPEFKTLLTQGNYAAFETAYEGLTWDAKSLLNEGIGLDAANAGLIEQWVEQRPDSYIAHLFAGVSKTCLAWIARTGALGSAVSEERAQQFFDLLEEAFDYLQRADELNPDDAEIYARMIRVCMGLQAEHATAASYFEAAKQLVPNHLIAHLMMINFLNPKWRGSLEEMQTFASTMYAETGSSLLVTLPLFSLTEEWLYYDINDEKQKKANFFKDPAVKETIRNLYAGYREEEDGKLLIPYVYNYFSFLFYMTGEQELARTTAQKIIGKMTVYPWTYIGIENNKELQQTLKR